MTIDPVGAVLASIVLAMVVNIRLEWREYQRSRVTARSVKELKK